MSSIQSALYMKTSLEGLVPSHDENNLFDRLLKGELPDDQIRFMIAEYTAGLEQIANDMAALERGVHDGVIEMDDETRQRYAELTARASDAVTSRRLCELALENKGNTAKM
jgi:hypothetical protein